MKQNHECYRLIEVNVIAWLIDWLIDVQVVFTDLNKEDVSRSEGRVWLVCNVIGDGNYQENNLEDMGVVWDLPKKIRPFSGEISPPSKLIHGALVTLFPNFAFKSHTIQHQNKGY